MCLRLFPRLVATNKFHFKNQTCFIYTSWDCQVYRAGCRSTSTTLFVGWSTLCTAKEKGAEESGEINISWGLKPHKYFSIKYCTITIKCDSFPTAAIGLGLCHPKIATVGTKCRWTFRTLILTFPPQWIYNGHTRIWYKLLINATDSYLKVKAYSSRRFLKNVIYLIVHHRSTLNRLGL